MHCIQINAMNYVRSVHEYIAHETDAWKIAHKLGLTVKIGADNALFGRIITLTREDFYSRRAQGIIRHEVAHYLLRMSGVEDQLLYLHGCYEDGVPSIEHLCYHAALVLQIPEPMLEQAQTELGNTPAAIVRMAELSGAPMVDALYRWVYAEVGAKRAAWVARGSLITHAASANCWIPFWKYAEVPDVLEEIPNAVLLPVGPRCVMGVVAW